VRGGRRPQPEKTKGSRESKSSKSDKSSQVKRGKGTQQKAQRNCGDTISLISSEPRREPFRPTFSSKNWLALTMPGSRSSNPKPLHATGGHIFTFIIQIHPTTLQIPSPVGRGTHLHLSFRVSAIAVEAASAPGGPGGTPARGSRQVPPPRFYTRCRELVV
jgi:hypothetical protein